MSQADIESRIAETRQSLNTLKWHFNSLAEKQKMAQSKGFSHEEVQEQLEPIVDTMAHIKASVREITQSVMEARKKAESQRKETDDINLTLQSFLYERNHYQREIYFCKEFRTPELDQVIKKACERQVQSLDLQSFIDLQKGVGKPIPQEKFQKMIDYLKATLRERQSLAAQLQKAQQEKDVQEQEFKKKTKLLSDFPAMLHKLEEASLPLQDYLSVTVTRDEQHRKTVARLPTALATLFEKLIVFAEQYPQFNLSVRVGGDQS